MNTPFAIFAIGSTIGTLLVFAINGELSGMSFLWLIMCYGFALGEAIYKRNR